MRADAVIRCPIQAMAKRMPHEGKRSAVRPWWRRRNRALNAPQRRGCSCAEASVDRQARRIFATGREAGQSKEYGSGGESRLQAKSAMRIAPGDYAPQSRKRDTTPRSDFRFRLNRSQWRDRAGVSPASTSRMRGILRANQCRLDKFRAGVGWMRHDGTKLMPVCVTTDIAASKETARARALELLCLPV